MTHVCLPTFSIIRIGILLLGMPLVAIAEDQSVSKTHLTTTILILVVMQLVLIIGLQRSRLKNKKAKNLLKQHQKELEEKINERTQSLGVKNAELESLIGNQKILANQLQETKRHLQTMINSVPDILVGINSESRITYWNTAAQKATGRSFDKALGIQVLKALPQLPISQEELTSALEDKKAIVSRRIQQEDKSQTKYYDLRLYPLSSESNLGAVIQLHDVTQQVNFENLMIQTEKMSSLGELAAGIAHEINNPLGIILHNTQNIVRRVAVDFPANQEVAGELGVDLKTINDYLSCREIPEFLDNIKIAGERAGKIVTNMLEFSRTSPTDMHWVDLRKLIPQSIEFTQNANFASRVKAAQIETQINIDEDFPLVFGSAPELQQVFVNLIRNAYQALLSEDYERPEHLVLSIHCHQRHKEAIIDITDNGPGIKDTHKSHIFEPFFTTKEVGKGTGLGLSVTYFIITEHHKGKISVQSHPGKGATFKIKLPIIGDRQITLDI